MAGKRKRASSPARTAHFVHEPFVDASKQIRLLTFEPGNDLDSISCNISTWSFDKARPYVAASYTWGSPENISCININGLPYEIRRNCYDALSQIRRQAPESYVWTDSICINQLDLDEKALQVENMGDIFANAELVYSCVGEHADGSGDVFSVAQDVAAHVKDTPLFYDMPTDNGAAWIAHGGDPRSPAWQRLNALQPDPIKDSEGGMVNSPPHPKFRDALMFFSCRPYWHRIWIIQEVYLAQRCIVLCGDDCVAFEDIVVLMITYQYALCVEQKRHIKSTWSRTLWGTFLWRLIFPTIRLDKGSIQQQGPLCLRQAVRSFGGWECSDARDRLYALLRIASWPSPCGPLKPDYRKSPVQVALDTLKCMRGA